MTDEVKKEVLAAGEQLLNRWKDEILKHSMTEICNCIDLGKPHKNIKECGVALVKEAKEIALLEAANVLSMKLPEKFRLADVIHELKVLSRKT